MKNNKDKEFYFFKHTSELHKKDLKFLIKYKSQGIGIYYLTLEHIILGQFKYNREDIFNLMELFTNESDFNEVVDYLIESGLLYTKEDNSLQSTLLDAEVLKEKDIKRKGVATGISHHIAKCIKEGGITALVAKYGEDLTEIEIKEAKEAAIYQDVNDSNMLKKWSLYISSLIAKNRELKSKN